MVLGMLFENFKNYYILRYVIYEFLKKVLGGPQPTCLVRVFCAGAQLAIQNWPHFTAGSPFSIDTLIIVKKYKIIQVWQYYLCESSEAG